MVKQSTINFHCTPFVSLEPSIVYVCFKTVIHIGLIIFDSLHKRIVETEYL